MVETARRYFFVHVMKTGGGTFNQHVLESFDADEIYPGPADPLPVAYFHLAPLLALPEERRRRIRMFRGHFPFVAAQLVDPDLVTLTVLRDPVDRTISFLKRRQRLVEPERSLEEIYEDHSVFETRIHNHQTKIFAMRPDDELESFLDVVDIDEGRLRTAKANLERTDVVGFQERFDDFIETLLQRFGWPDVPVPNVHVSGRRHVDPSFRRRIEEDNEMDMAFIDHARSITG